MIDMLREVTEKDHDVILDLRYASTNNVFGKVFYQSEKCLLHVETEEKLKLAVSLAKVHNLRLKIFDCYRPLDVQKEFIRLKPGCEFISDPKTGSIPHCRGLAVDLTLTDLNGVELDMGSDFDEFSEIAFHGSTNISKEAQKNRYLIMGIMMTAGFDFFRNEWWHYQLFNARDYEVFNEAL